jgi:hypothetical protein
VEGGMVMVTVVPMVRVVGCGPVCGMVIVVVPGMGKPVGGTIPVVPVGGKVPVVPVLGTVPVGGMVPVVIDGP